LKPITPVQPRIVDQRYREPNTSRRYFVSSPQYTVMRRNQEFCQSYRVGGHEACNECKKLNPEKWRLCHTVPVAGTDKRRPEWKR